MKAREYAESIKAVHGGNAKCAWMTVDELLDLYDRLDRTQNMLDQATTFDEPAFVRNAFEDREQTIIDEMQADSLDLETTIQSIRSSMLPY